MVTDEEGLVRRQRLTRWEMPKSKVSDQGPGKQSPGPLKGAADTERYFRHFHYHCHGNFTHRFLDGGEECFRDQTLSYKSNIPIHWERTSTTKITGDVLMGRILSA